MKLSCSRDNSVVLEIHSVGFSGDLLDSLGFSWILWESLSNSLDIAHACLRISADSWRKSSLFGDFLILSPSLRLAKRRSVSASYFGSVLAGRGNDVWTSHCSHRALIAAFARSRAIDNKTCISLSIAVVSFSSFEYLDLVWPKALYFLRTLSKWRSFTHSGSVGKRFEVGRALLFLRVCFSFCRSHTYTGPLRNLF